MTQLYILNNHTTIVKTLGKTLIKLSQIAGLFPQELLNSITISVYTQDILQKFHKVLNCF